MRYDTQETQIQHSMNESEISEQKSSTQNKKEREGANLEEGKRGADGSGTIIQEKEHIKHM